jgi:hypothetical protein
VKAWLAGGALLLAAELAFCVACALSGPFGARFFPVLLPYVARFEPPQPPTKVDESLWTRLQAEVRLPLRLVGAAEIIVDVSSPAGPRAVELTLNGAPLARTTLAGSERVQLRAVAGGRFIPLDFGLSVTPLNDRLRGIRVYRIAVRPTGGFLAPTPWTLAMLGAALAALAGALCYSGLARRRAWLIASLGVGGALVATAAVNPLAATALVMRLAWWIPILVLAVSWLVKRVVRLPAAGARAGDVVTVALLLAAGLALKGGWLLQPAHYHKDVPTHAIIATIGMEEGLGPLWTNISEYQYEYDLGRTNFPGGLSTIRYPPTFFTLAHVFTVLQRWVTGAYDVEYWNRLLALSFSALQIVPIFFIALRITGSRAAAILCGVLELFSPLEFHELAGASFPAILGKLVDLIVLAYVILQGRAVRWYALAVLVFCSLMTYPASWVTMGTLLGLQLLFAACAREWRAVALTALAGAVAATAAHLSFYGTLLLDVFRFHLPAGMARDEPGRLAGLLDVGRWFWAEYAVYYTSLHLAAFACGVWLLWRAGHERVRRSWIAAWVACFVVSPAIQSIGGSVLVYYRGFFLVAPLVSLFAAWTVHDVWQRFGRRGRAWGLLLFAALLLLQLVKIGGMIPPFFTRYDAQMPPGWRF